MKKQFKTIIALALIITMSAACAPVANAALVSNEATLMAAAPQVRANGNLVSFPDAQPFIDSNNRTLIPVRFATEALGAEVSWDAAKNIATIKKNDVVVQVPIDSKNLKVTKNGTVSTVTMDTEAIISNDRTYVPIRFVAEALGGWVGYSDLYNTVQIYQDKLTPEEINRLHGYYDMGYVEATKAGGRYDNLISLGYKVVDDPVTMKNYSGTYGMNNANEESFHNADSLYSLKKQQFQDSVTGKWYYPTTNTDAEYAIAFARNASATIYELVSFSNSGKVKVDFKADASSVYHSKCQNTIYVRGVCTIEFASNYDASKLAATVKCGAFPFTPQPGQTYTFDAEFMVDYSCNRIWTPKLVNLETRNVVKLY